MSDRRTFTVGGPAGTGADRLGFTLMEMMAVMTVLVLLAGLVIGIASYADRRSKISLAQATVATLSSGCESYRIDRGRYPTSTIFRTALYQSYGAGNGRESRYWEGMNNSLMLQQLASGKGYLQRSPNLVQTWNCAPWDAPPCSNGLWGGWQASMGFVWLQAAVDPWANPYSYYCTYPRMTTSYVVNSSMALCTYEWQTTGPPYSVTAGWTNSGMVGRQKNADTFDLYSYGPNRNDDAGVGDDIGNVSRSVN